MSSPRLDFAESFDLRVNSLNILIRPCRIRQYLDGSRWQIKICEVVLPLTVEIQANGVVRFAVIARAQS